MRRISDTELVRNYCENHKGDIFDINYASEHVFKDIPHVNLRKIVSRLIDSGLLRTISKGVYAIGEFDLSDEETTNPILKSYFDIEMKYTIKCLKRDLLLKGISMLFSRRI